MKVFLNNKFRSSHVNGNLKEIEDLVCRMLRKGCLALQASL